jgi:hypothetical protein
MLHATAKQSFFLAIVLGFALVIMAIVIVGYVRGKWGAFLVGAPFVSLGALVFFAYAFLLPMAWNSLFALYEVRGAVG